MKEFQGKGRETKNLEQIYKKLEQDWNAMKENSNSSKKFMSRQGYEYVSNFSRKIMCEHQHDEGTHSPQKEEEEKDYYIIHYSTMIESSDNDIEAREAIHERVEAIKSGKLKCIMPLFNLRKDDAKIFKDVNSSSIYADEIRSKFYDSDDDEYEKCCPDNCCALSGGCYSSSSASSSSSYNAEAVLDMVARVLEMRLASVENRRKRRRMFVSIFSWFIAFLFLVISMFVIYGRVGAGEVVLVAT